MRWPGNSRVSSRQRHFKLFLLFFIPLWVVLTLAGAAWVVLTLREQSLELDRSLARQAQQLVNHAEMKLKNLVSDAALLGMHPRLKPLRASREEGPLALLGQAYLAFGRSKPGFTRIQLLDLQGGRLLEVDSRRESVITHYPGSKPTPSAATLLKQALQLAPRELLLRTRPPGAPGEEWYLELALPMLGAGGQHWGLLWLEYSGAEFAQGLLRELNGPHWVLIQDGQGRTLHCESLGQEEIIPGEARSRVCAGLPRPIKPGRLSGKDTLGQARGFSAMHEALMFSTGGGEATLTSAAAARLTQEHRWTLAVLRPRPSLGHTLAGMAHHLVPTYLAAAMALGMACWLGAGIARRRLEAQQDRRRAAERFRIRTAFDHSAVGMAVVSLEGRFLEANPFLCRLLGVQRAGLIGHNFRPYLRARDYRRLLSGFKRMLNRQPPSLWMQSRLLAAGGHTRWAMLSISLACDHSGLPLHCVVHVQDITQTKELAAEKQAMEAELRRALKLEAIGTLASGIAHDFNNLLGIVLTNTELCLKQESDPAGPGQRRLQQVLKAAERGRDLVRQIINIYKPHQLEREPILLAEALGDVLNLVSASIPKNIRLESRLPAPGPVVLASLSEVQQVVTNLCLNAVHAMGEAGGVLFVRLSHTGGRPAWAQLQIEDTGCGMDQATMKNAFDPFFTTKTQGKGTGLGLATVQRVISSLGGKVGIGSQLGQGTVVTVYLPVSAQVPAQGRPQPAPSHGGGHLLVVDDESAYLEALEEALEGFGFEVTALDDPQRAWRCFQDHSGEFNALISDHHMPGLSGAELARRVGGLRPDLPVILCTGSPHTLSLDLEQDGHAWRVLRKPFAIVELLELLGQLLPPQEGVADISCGKVG